MPNKTIELFKQIQHPNEIIRNLLFNACAQVRTDEALNLVRKVASSMPKSSYSNVFVITGLLDALMKCGAVDSARSVFKASTKKDEPMYATMMKGNNNK